MNTQDIFDGMADYVNALNDEIENEIQGDNYYKYSALLAFVAVTQTCFTLMVETLHDHLFSDYEKKNYIACGIVEGNERVKFRHSLVVAFQHPKPFLDYCADKVDHLLVCVLRDPKSQAWIAMDTHEAVGIASADQIGLRRSCRRELI